MYFKTKGAITRYTITHVAIDKFQEQGDFVPLNLFRRDLRRDPSFSRIRLPDSSADIVIVSHGTSSRRARRAGEYHGQDFS